MNKLETVHQVENAPLQEALRNQTKLNLVAGYPDRLHVPDWATDWSVPYDYQPSYSVDQHVIDFEGIWADPENMDFSDLPNRSIAFAEIQRDEAGKPLNPFGRTGIAGRGMLGRWGANITADSFITRTNPKTGRLEAVIIERREGLFGFPGGFWDAHDGETIYEAAIRESGEEVRMLLPEDSGDLVCGGFYVPSARTTDNAWIETNGFHWHLGETFILPIPNLSELKGAEWMPINAYLFDLVMNEHKQLMVELVKKLRADGLI